MHKAVWRNYQTDKGQIQTGLVPIDEAGKAVKYVKKIPRIFDESCADVVVAVAKNATATNDNKEGSEVE